MSNKEYHVILPRENRQGQIEALDIGQTIAIAHRMDLRYGFSEDAISTLTNRLRQVLDQQVHRARRRLNERRWTIETGHYLTRADALVITAACTRTE